MKELFLDSKLLIQKQTLKGCKEKIPPDAELYEMMLPTVVKDEEFLQGFTINKHVSPESVGDEKDFVVKGFSDDPKKVTSSIIGIISIDVIICTHTVILSLCPKFLVL